MRQRRSTAPAAERRARRKSSSVAALEQLGEKTGAWSPQILHTTTYTNWPSFPWREGAADDGGAAPFERALDAATLARLKRSAERAEEEGDDDEPDLPVWWITFQMSFWAPQWIIGGLLVGILIPFRLLEIVGEDRKAHALALVTVCQTVVNLCGPLFGGLSDAMPYTRLGRRRPFIVVGMLCVSGSILVMWFSHEYVAFMVAWAVFCVGNNCAQPAFSCVLPELIPARQRGLASGIFVFFQVFGALVSSGLGLLVGKGVIADDIAYWILSALAFGSMITGCIGMGRRPGLWSPERPPLDESAAKDKDAKKEEKEEKEGKEGGEVERVEERKEQCDGCREALPAPLRTLLSFFTAFEVANFRWLFLYIFLWSSSGQFGMLFQAYWMQDIIG